MRRDHFCGRTGQPCTQASPPPYKQDLRPVDVSREGGGSERNVDVSGYKIDLSVFPYYLSGDFGVRRVSS